MGLLRARTLSVMTILFMVPIKDPGPQSSCDVRGTCQAHVQGNSCLTEEDITSNLCKTALYYTRLFFSFFLNLEVVSLRVREKVVVSEGLIQLKSRVRCKETWLTSALHWACNYCPRPLGTEAVRNVFHLLKNQDLGGKKKS